MLVNVSRHTNIHKRMAFLIEGYVKKLKEELLACAKLPNPEKQSSLIAKIKQVFQDQIKQDGFNTEFSWQQVLDVLADIIYDENEDILVKDIHTDTKHPINYKEDKNVIAVGGLSLSRGFTLEGLSVSYFVRNSIYYDTLMQMGRWFGYREGYDDLCKIYMPKETQENFAFIAECMDELMQKFKEMSREKLTPLDFGLAVRQDPRCLLQITANNKRRHAKEVMLSLDLSGKLIETRKFSTDESIQKKNFELLLNFLGSLKNHHCKDTHAYSNVGNAILYTDVAKDQIQGFIENFKTDAISVYKQWVLEYLDRNDGDWDVALYSGEGEQVEKLGCKAILRETGEENTDGTLSFPYRNRISQAYPERVFIQEKIEKGSGYASRLKKALKKPALMLHVLTIEIKDQDKQYDKIVAYGLCFPDKGVHDNSQTVSYLANMVFQEQIIESQGYGLEEDDEDE